MNGAAVLLLVIALFVVGSDVARWFTHKERVAQIDARLEAGREETKRLELITNTYKENLSEQKTAGQ